MHTHSHHYGNTLGSSTRKPIPDTLAAGDADLELVQTCQATFLPFGCVVVCMALLLMRELWEMVGQPLANAGRGQEMSVFLDWIWVTSVYSAAQVPPTVQLAAPPGAPLADARLLGFLGNVVQWWLLGLAIIALHFSWWQEGPKW